MNNSQPTNDNERVEDFFSRQREAQAAGDSDEQKKWYVDEFQRRETGTRRKTRPWRYLGNAAVALLVSYFLIAPWQRGFAHLGRESFLFIPVSLFVVWLAAIVGFMVTRRLICPKCHRELSEKVKNHCPHCAVTLRLDSPKRRLDRRVVRAFAAFVVIASVGASWVGAGLLRERRLNRERQVALELQQKQPFLISFEQGPARFEELSGDMALPGHSLCAAFQVRRAYVECWIGIEADGAEMAKGNVLRIDRTSFPDADGEGEDVTVNILCTQTAGPDARLTPSGLDLSFRYGLVLLGERGNSRVHAGPTEVVVNFGVMRTSTPSFREHFEPNPTELPKEPTQPFTVYAVSTNGRIVDPDNETQLRERKITYRVMCRLVDNDSLAEQ